jgi:mono/diheme cytochrome c family protein
MNRLFVRDLLIVVCAIAAITTFVLAVTTRNFVEHRTEIAVRAGAPPTARLGARVFAAKCSSCHTDDGTPRIGPSFLHDYGSQVHLDDGRVIAMNEAYIRESLFYPRAKARPGYPPSMPSFDGLLSDREVSALVAYLQSLQ